MPVSVQTKSQITDLLERYQSAYNDHNADGLAVLLAADVVMYGRYKTGGIRFADAEIKSEGVIAWVSASCMLLSTAGSGAVHETPCRFTAVLRGTGHAWEFAQIHMSLGYPYHA